MSKISTRDVLKILGITTLVVSSTIFPNLPQAIVAVHKAWRNINKKDLGRIIKRLERQQMICIKAEGEKTIIEITEKGKRRLLEYDFENIEIKLKKRDRKWRLVMFDIPDERKSARDIFRRKLIQLECISLRESVFASVYPCKNEIDFLCNFLGISDYVTVVKLDNIERGQQLIFKDYKEWDN